MSHLVLCLNLPDRSFLISQLFSLLYPGVLITDTGIPVSLVVQSISSSPERTIASLYPVSYTHLTLPTNREV